MAAAKRTHDEVRVKHGPGFAGTYEWSIPLLEGNRNPRLEDLEQLLDMTRMRPWRKWADRAQVALIALVQTLTISIVRGDAGRSRDLRT